MENIGNLIRIVFVLMALQPMMQQFLVNRKRQDQIKKIQR
jgi:hypothetical protein